MAARVARVAAATLGAALLLFFLSVLLADARTEAAARRDLGVGTDPAIEAVVVTGSLPVSDTRPGEGVSRTIYFGNANPGVLTLALEVSGTSPLTLSAGAAFDDPPQTLTSPGSPWSPVVTYSVETGGGDWPNVPYTATNPGGDHAMVTITFTRDITAPSVPVPVYPVTGTVVPTTTVPFTWEASSDHLSGVMGYAVVVTGASETHWHTLGSITSTLLDLGLDGGYSWGVQALDGVGNVSDLSEPVDFSVSVPPRPTVDFDRVDYSVDEGTGTATITVTVDPASYRTVSVNYATTSGGSATPDVDYTPVTGTLVFDPYVTSLTFTVDITDDVRAEADETVVLTLSDAEHATLGDTNNPATVTIVDDDCGVYLPLAARELYRPEFYEPNDTPGDAYGPLLAGVTYCAYIWNAGDPDDYYHFTPATGEEVRVTLTNIPEHCDYDLYVYRHDGSQYVLVAYSNISGNADERLTFSPIPHEKYFIRVYPYAGSSNQQCYHLRVDYR